jgi:C1A family cysteine protease
MAAPMYALGWIPDRPDRRDHLYSAPVANLLSLPPKVDLRDQFTQPPYDQGHVGSCTANAIAGAIEFDRAKLKFGPNFVPSRNFIYYNERFLEHTVNSDAGAMLRDGIKTVSKQGVCPEDDWTYDDRLPEDQGGPNTKVFEKPSAAAFAAAQKYQVKGYLRIVQSLSQMKGCLASGYPFVIGFTCYDSLQYDQTAKTGDIPMPVDGEGVIGGHAVVVTGYEEARQVFFIRNSWGTDWGNGGYGTIPYAYLVDRTLSQDFWTIRTMTA